MYQKACTCAHKPIPLQAWSPHEILTVRPMRVGISKAEPCQFQRKDRYTPSNQETGWCPRPKMDQVEGLHQPRTAENYTWWLHQPRTAKNYTWRLHQPCVGNNNMDGPQTWHPLWWHGCSLRGGSVSAALSIIIIFPILYIKWDLPKNEETSHNITHQKSSPTCRP